MQFEKRVKAFFERKHATQVAITRLGFELDPAHSISYKHRSLENLRRQINGVSPWVPAISKKSPGVSINDEMYVYYISGKSVPRPLIPLYKRRIADKLPEFEGLISDMEALVGKTVMLGSLPKDPASRKEYRRIRAANVFDKIGAGQRGW